MSLGKEIQQQIGIGAVDSRVAEWVIGNLPLLDVFPLENPAPILRVDTDLAEIQGLGSLAFKEKLLMSGGFEGTYGHMKAIYDMHEVRTLTNSSIQLLLLLEPDSYAHFKGRAPIVPCDVRSILWANSGLVDGVVLLPEPADYSDSALMRDRYSRIQELLSPAIWCANIENPHMNEIITRGNPEYLNYIDLIRIFVHGAYPSTSFLHAALGLSLDTLIEDIRKEAARLSQFKGVDGFAQFFTQEEREGMIFEKFTQNLRF